jgi:hypothetical protein
MLMGQSSKFAVKVCPIAILLTTPSTWRFVGLKPGLHGDRSATNCLIRLNIHIYMYIYTYIW